MVDQNGAYLFKKRDIYYFSKRIPTDLKHLYQVERLTKSLRTKCERKARSQSQAMLLKLEDHWSKARLHNDLFHSKSLNQNKVIKFTESVSVNVHTHTYVRDKKIYNLKGKQKIRDRSEQEVVH